MQSVNQPQRQQAAAVRGEGRPRMSCLSCRELYAESQAGTCKECYEEASETEVELKEEIEQLKSKVAFLRLSSPADPHHPCPSSSTDVSLHASSQPECPSVSAHRAVLMSRSPVFRAMLDNEMEESRSGTIRIPDVSYDVLRSFVHYLYTAEVLLDEQMACELLVLAEKYQVKHLKAFCENFMTSQVNNNNAIASFAFAQQHNAKELRETALSSILENMSTLTGKEEYKEFVEKDPRLVVEIYEAYLTRQVNIAASDSKLHQI